MAKFEKKCAIVSFAELSSTKNVPYAKLRLIDEEGKQYDAFYFDYVESDQQHLSDPEAVYDITGSVNEDGTVKVKDITRLEEANASTFHKNIYDIKELSKKFLLFVKENIREEKYLSLLKSTMLASGTLSKFCKAPFHPVSNHEGSLLDHVNNNLELCKFVIDYYQKYNFVIDVQAMYCAIILCHASKVVLEKKGYCNFGFTEKQNIIGDDVLALHQLLPKMEKLEDYVCLIDILQSMIKKCYPSTVEGRIINYIASMDRVTQMLIVALHNRSQEKSTVVVDINGTKVDLFYPSIQ